MAEVGILVFVLGGWGLLSLLVMGFAGWWGKKK